MHVAADVTELIGETPLVRADSIAENLLVKLESFNPYSVKDRIAREMLDAAAEAGELTAETVVIEPTSGNTGIGLAAVCAARDQELILTMPESMSEERRKLLRALGAELELTDADGGMGGAIDRADELAEEYDDTFIPQQFENPANPQAHRRTTGPELDEATDGELDVFVAGVGTGGTITGVGTYFQEADADVDLIAVEPEDSAVLSGREAGSHGIQGIGAGFIPDILERDLLDEVRTVGKDDSIEMARRLASEEGIAGGISTGANVHVAAEVARERPNNLVATIVCDPGERYLSTDLYDF
ncbi:cysteine synthase A [Halapricum hydrolyticum]|uniref:cysteine synthase n=1 Tax=Halapricum hydrolyticum TaxID=2979991 RepID=A0AAE3LJN4_9EURY|nr:cysteine synthase A [Halapricum hydrolyticum]MCU4718463.1 cysteine synthase A [Halapricum hydrolyticum]MCU4727518.1 cysteine synthase A [Halapricum hydrolyticum]